MSLFLPGMRRTASRLLASPSVCSQCLTRRYLAKQVHQLTQPAAAASSPSVVARTTSGATRWRRALATTSAAKSSQATAAPTVPHTTAATVATDGVRGAGAGGTTSGTTDYPAARSSTASSFPEKTTSRAVALWLLGSAASVFGIVVFGGLTRLTESGLSITEWRPITGSIPPMTATDWESEFAKYRSSPEFALLNSRMTLSEFQQIYWMEWTHRLWGRVVGLTFALPALYFVARRRVSPRMAWNLLGITSLIGVQGGIGWWMVASGLKDDLFAPGSHPRVSQYRLTAHLATAFVCYGWMLLSALTVLRTRRLLLSPGPGAAASALQAALAAPALRPLRVATTLLAALVFTTVLSGALVAGLDAGLIYNEFPYMGLGLTPPKSELLDPFYSRRDDRSDLLWRNALENPSTVQLDHRVLATATFTAVVALWLWTRRGAKLRAAMPRDVAKAASGVLHMALLQVTLGISTLIYMVPVPLAAAHQAGSLGLLTAVLVLAHRLRVPKSTVRAIERGLRLQRK